MIPGAANPLLLASAAGAVGYEIERSLRFNSADSAYLSRTPSVAGNRKTWTWAGWVKYTYTSTSNQALLAADSGSPYNIFGFLSNGALRFETTSGASCVTASLLRDPSSWYHVVLAVDTTQVTASNRLKIYVNSVLQSLSVATYPFSGEELLINNSQLQTIGRWNNQRYLNGYLADIHFIDGQALDPTSFGEFDTNGVWQPKAYTGSYPGNSFHLDFADNSAATTAGIGKDVSGNGNDWTPVNLSVAAGASNDSLVDTPTNYGTDTGAGGEVRGNYCTWNPVNSSSLLTPSNGNLELTGTGAGATFGNSRGSIALTNSKYYWETVVAATRTYQRWGIAPTDTPCENGGSEALGNSDIPNSVGLNCNTGSVSVNGSIVYTGSGAIASGAIVGHAFDGTSGNYWISVNGVWLTGNPATNTTPITTVSLTRTWLPAASDATSQTLVANFGQRPFAYTAPSGFKALCTANLPEPQTITTSGSYTGNGVADGPFVYLNGVPTAMTVNGNAVTFGTEADKLSNGFKVRTTSTTYNQNAVVYNYSITSTGDPFKRARAQSNQ